MGKTVSGQQRPFPVQLVWNEMSVMTFWIIWPGWKGRILAGKDALKFKVWIWIMGTMFEPLLLENGEEFGGATGQVR